MLMSRLLYLLQKLIRSAEAHISDILISTPGVLSKLLTNSKQTVILTCKQMCIYCLHRFLKMCPFFHIMNHNASEPHISAPFLVKSARKFLDNLENMT